MDMRLPVIILLLMVAHFSWAKKETLDGLTICLRMKIKYFTTEYENIVTLDSRDVLIVLSPISLTLSMIGFYQLIIFSFPQ